MKSTRLVAWLLALLGFQMQSCTEETEEPPMYGSPYTTYKTRGTVLDENGNKIQDAKVNVRIDAIIEQKDSTGVHRDTIWHSNETVLSNRRGKYETMRAGEDLSYDRSYIYEVVTNKDGFAPDTIHKEVKGNELKLEQGNKWESIATQEIDIVLKKK